MIDFLISKFKIEEKVNDQDAYLKLNLARLYMLKAGFLQKDTLAFKQVLDDANYVIQKSISLSPERLHNYYFSSKIKNALGDNQGAIADLEKALSYNLDYADTYLYLSQAYGLEGNEEKEAEYLNKAYELKPSLKK